MERKWPGKDKQFMNIIKLVIFPIILMLFIINSYTTEVKAAANVSAPTSVKVKTNDKGDPEITWKKVSKATGYEVYRKTAKDSSWVKVAITKENICVDENWVAGSNSAIQYAVSVYIQKGDSITRSKKSNTVKWKVPAYSKGLEYELKNKGTEYWVIGIGSCRDTDIVFPTRYQGLPVTRIEKLGELPDIKSIKISASITEIGEMAFRSCIGLTEIYIPKTVEKIYINPFAECSNIIRIHVDEENPYYDSRNDCNAIIETATDTIITGCSNTVIPNSIKAIGDYSFIECDTLTDIILPSGLVSIGDNAFRRCSNINNIIIPNSVTSIGKGAFAECSELINISLPEKLSKISSFTFFECVSMQSILIPKSVTVIEDFAFRNCISLKNIILPEGITEIYPYTFSGCASLTEIDIPDGVKSIEYNAFSECIALTGINLPKSLKYLGQEAFLKCKSLTGIDIPYGITVIRERTFEECSRLQKVNLPDSVTKIEDAAFLCSGITNLPNMKNVTSIGEQAFSLCLNLRDITIPDSVKEIGTQAFFLCNLVNVTIPESVTSIGFAPFWINIYLNIRVVKGSYADTILREYGYSDWMSYIN